MLACDDILKGYSIFLLNRDKREEDRASFALVIIPSKRNKSYINIKVEHSIFGDIDPRYGIKDQMNISMELKMMKRKKCINDLELNIKEKKYLDDTEIVQTLEQRFFSFRFACAIVIEQLQNITLP
ncbi:MAG: hypothetical protein EZS28_032183 [Streblomastix strix]|uniref:Uncharacterized protein n=1 Tax=Streblomastix strix TaxID=222440 RepID=A0A5J4UQE3_9EUKA|nr:MAG: hypothetical protein EZS28_032183 [Streblomastix strix]